MKESAHSRWNDGLPPEILARIFRILAADIYFNSRIHMWRPSKALGIILVSHVCRYWREVALGDACLWGYDVCFPLGRAVAKKLVRSGDTPIFVRWKHFLDSSEDGDPRPSSRVYKHFQKVLHHAKRFRALRISDPVQEKRFWTTLCTSSPWLETLEIGTDSTYRLDSALGFHIPNQLMEVYSLRSSFGDRNGLWSEFPALRNLRLTHRALRWSSPLFASSLLSLHVEIDRKYHQQPQPKFTRHGIVVALSKMPNLQSLVLIFAIPPIAGPRSKNHDFKAHLPSLRSMVIVDRPAPPTQLLDKIVIPSSAHLLISCETVPPIPAILDSNNVEDCCTLIPFIARQLSSGVETISGPLRSLEIQLTFRDQETSYTRLEEQFIEIKGWNCDFHGSPSSMKKHSVEPSIALSLLTRVGDELHSCHRIFGAICDALGRYLDEVTLLAISIMFRGQKVWTRGGEFEVFRILDHTPNVRSLHLESSAILPVLRLLARNDKSLPAKDSIHPRIQGPIWAQDTPKAGSRSFVEGNPSGSLVLPHLSRLVLEDGSLDIVVEPEKWRVDDMLLRTLAARRALQRSGDPFHLSLPCTQASDLAVKKLVEVVPEFEWEEPASENEWEEGEEQDSDKEESDEEVVREI